MYVLNLIIFNFVNLMKIENLCSHRIYLSVSYTICGKLDKQQNAIMYERMTN